MDKAAVFYTARYGFDSCRAGQLNSNIMLNVLVVTSPELGWDCVVGVYADTPENRVALERYYPEWIISKREVRMFAEEEE